MNILVLMWNKDTKMAKVVASEQGDMQEYPGVNLKIQTLNNDMRVVLTDRDQIDIIVADFPYHLTAITYEQEPS